MENILRANQSQKVRRGKFNIDIIFPGLGVQLPVDPRGFAQLGRFDHAHLYPGVFVPMHLHQNDEIFTYMREGNMVHEDSEGKKEVLSSTRMMLMNAGSGIYHQESVPDDGTDVRLLQIFIRPEKEDTAPFVQFASFDQAYSVNVWRLLAGSDEGVAPLHIRSHVNVFDIRVIKSDVTLPYKSGKSYLLFVFNGMVVINGDVLNTGDSFIYNAASAHVSSNSIADLVLFELDERASYTRNGMYSGT